MAAQLPVIKARLLVLFPTLAGWTNIVVISGQPGTTFPGDNYCTVGYNSDGQAGYYRSEQDGSGARWIETGSLSCELVCKAGDEDLTITETRVQAALDGVDAAVRADRRLGVLSQEGTSSFSVTDLPVLSPDGTAFIARFTLDYYTVT